MKALLLLAICLPLASCDTLFPGQGTSSTGVIRTTTHGLDGRITETVQPAPDPFTTTVLAPYIEGMRNR